MAQLDGFDIAGTYQPGFPWQWSRSQGHQLAIAKVSEDDHFSDPEWGRNRALMEQCGFRWKGAYHWVGNQPITQQLSRFSRLFGVTCPPGWFVMLDIEENALDPAKIVDTINAFQQVYGNNLLVYFGWWYTASGVRLATDGRFAPWLKDRWVLPWYASTFPTQVTSNPVIWQWGGGKNGAPVAGWAHVDSNMVMRPIVLDTVCQVKPAPTDLTEAIVNQLPTVRPGDRGPAVRRVQGLLYAGGFDIGTVDGIYGPKTEGAVRAFQSMCHITSDGVVGIKETWPHLLGVA